MKKDIFLILLSSALLIFSFPNFNFWLLAWFGFIPLLFAIQNKSKFKAFSLFYLTGVIFWLGTVYWLIHVTALGMILLVLYLALYFGIFGLIVSQAYILPTTYYLLFIPSIWVLLEYLRNHLFSGFGWALLGYSQYLNLAVIQIADTSGVYGVSFLVMTINVAIKQIIGFSQGSAKIKALKWPLVISLSMLAAAFFYGYLRVNKIEHQRPYGSLKVAVIQGNIPQRLKWRSVAKGYIMQEYLGLSRQASRDKPDLMIWPEAALPVIIQEEPGFFEQARQLVVSTEIPLLLGAVTFRDDIYYNSALLIPDPARQPLGYDKLHLVPFGEYIPLKPFFNFLETIVPIGDFKPGKEYTVFTFITPHSLVPARFSVLICFEDLFPELSRQFARKGADFLVNITNDAWFGKTPAPYQHLSASVLRAVENRLPLVRAANTGVSGFIAASGRIISLVSDERGEEIFIKGYRSERINLSRGSLTPYARYGDILVVICFLWGLYGIMRILKNQK